jgi:hypothetical protein
MRPAKWSPAKAQSVQVDALCQPEPRAFVPARNADRSGPGIALENMDRSYNVSLRFAALRAPNLPVRSRPVISVSRPWTNPLAREGLPTNIQGQIGDGNPLRLRAATDVPFDR